VLVGELHPSRSPDRRCGASGGLQTLDRVLDGVREALAALVVAQKAAPVRASVIDLWTEPVSGSDEACQQPVWGSWRSSKRPQGHRP
jgi:hypothetical protein